MLARGVKISGTNSGATIVYPARAGVNRIASHLADTQKSVFQGQLREDLYGQVPPEQLRATAE